MTVAAVMTYDSLVNDIQTYLERTDQQTLDKIPQFIMLAEQVIAAEIKFLGNLTVAESTMVQNENVIPKPARWRKTVEKHGQTLEVKSSGTKRYWPRLAHFGSLCTPKTAGAAISSHCLIARTLSATSDNGEQNDSRRRNDV